MYFNYALLVTTLYIWEGNCIIPLVTIKRKDLAAGHQDHLQTLPGCSRFNPVILFPWGTFLYYFPNLIREEKKQSEYLHDGYLGISGWNKWLESIQPISKTWTPRSCFGSHSAQAWRRSSDAVSVRGDRIPVELFQILKDDAFRIDILTIWHIDILNMSANLENSRVATGLEKVSFHSNLKEWQCQRMLKLSHNSPISHASKVMLKIL